MKKVKDRTLKLCDEVELTLYEEGGKYYIDSKQLYEWLEVKTPYAKWFSRRIKQYKFKEENDYLMYYYKDDFNKLTTDKSVHVENIENTKNINCKNLKKLSDFTNSKQATAGLGYSKKYFLLPDMAKQLAMVEDADKGALVRQYYLDLEKYIDETKQRELFKEWRKLDAEKRLELHDLISDDRACKDISIEMYRIVSYLNKLDNMYKKDDLYRRYIKDIDRQSWIKYLEIQDMVEHFVNTFMSQGTSNLSKDVIKLLREVYISDMDSYRSYVRTHKVY